MHKLNDLVPPVSRKHFWLCKQTRTDSKTVGGLFCPLWNYGADTWLNQRMLWQIAQGFQNLWGARGYNRMPVQHCSVKWLTSSTITAAGCIGFSLLIFVFSPYGFVATFWPVPGYWWSCFTTAVLALVKLSCLQDPSRSLQAHIQHHILIDSKTDSVADCSNPLLTVWTFWTFWTQLLFFSWSWHSPLLLGPMVPACMILIAFLKELHWNCAVSCWTVSTRIQKHPKAC